MQILCGLLQKKFGQKRINAVEEVVFWNFHSNRVPC